MATRNTVILWAQRHKKLFLTIAQEDVTKFSISSTDPESVENVVLTFTEHGNEHNVPLHLYGYVDLDSKQVNNTSRQVEIALEKKASDWWPRLLSDKVKVPWIRVNFNKWTDESDEENDNTEEEDDLDYGNFEEMMANANPELPTEPDDDVPPLNDAAGIEGAHGAN